MAGGKVRGISIELSADTSGIAKGLKSADSAIRKTQKELRDINRLLKLDPNNMTLLNQRTKALQTQIGNTSKKLKELKQLEKQMKAEGIDENSEQFQALQREIIATEQQLKSLQSTAGSGSAKLLQISNASKKLGDNLTKAGEKLLPLTAGIAGLAGAAVKVAADFEEQMSKVQAISGATAEDMQMLEEKAREMGASTKFSAQEAGEAMEYMAMAGWKTEDMVNGVEGIMNLAAASGEELGKTSDIVTDALTAFGMSAKESGRLADILAAASSNANTNVSMLGESFKYVAPVAGAMGYSAEDVATALGVMANSGIKASSAGTALRTLLTNMANPTKTMEKAMTDLGVSLDDGQGNMKSMKEVLQDLRSGFSGLKKPEAEALKQLEQLDEQLADGTITEKKYNKLLDEWTKKTYGAEGALKAQAAASLAGKNGLAGLLAIVNTSEEDFNKLSNAIENSEGTAKKMADTMQDNLAGQITIIKSSLQELAISFGKILIPYIKKAVSFIQDLINKFNGMSDAQKGLVLKIAGIVAAIGPALIVLGKLATAISAVTKVMSTAKFMAFLTNPVTLAIAAVAGLAAGLYALKKAYDKANNPLFTFKERTKEVKDANDELARSIEESNKQLEDNITQADLNAASAENLKNVLDDLIEKEDKTASDKERIKDIVEELNKIVPNLNLAYDEQADALNKTNQEIESHIGLMKQEMIAESYRDAWTKAVNEQTQAQLNLSDAQDNFNQMLEQAPDDLKELYKIYKEYGNEAEMFADGYGDQLLRNGDALRDLAAAEKEVETAQDNVAESAGRADKIYQQWTEQAELLSQAQADFNLENVRNQFKQTFGDEYTAELDAAITKAVEAGVEIPESIATNIADGKGDVDSAITQINKAISLEEARKRAKTDGSGIPTDAAKAMNGSKDKIVNANANLDKAISLEKARQRAQKDGSGIPTDAAAAMNAGKDKVKGAADTLVESADVSQAASNAKTSGENTGSSFATGISSAEGATATAASGLVTTAQNNLNGGSAYDLGSTFGRSYGDGLESAGWYVGRIAAGLVDKVKGAIQNAQESGSPSKVAMSLGDDFGEGYVIGLEGSIKAARKAAQALVSTPSTLAPMGYNRASSGAVSNQYIYNQTNNSPAALTPSEIYRQSKNLLNLKGASV